MQIFWQGKAQNSSPILRCTFLARRSAKLIANFSATRVTSLPSFSLSLSDTVSLSLSHRMYLTHNIGSASALPIIQTERERETQRDGSDVTIVALKLAMNLHFPLPKIRTIGDELTLSLAKNSHFSFLPSHFPSLPSRRGHQCGAQIRNEFTLSIAKNFFALLVPPLSNGTSRATSDRKPKTNDQTLPSPSSSHRKNESN